MTAAPTVPADASVQLHSDLLGALDVPADALYDFPDGIPGFEQFRRHALVPSGREGLYWLQSLEASGLVFLLADPFKWMPDYEIDVSPADLRALGATRIEEVAVLAIVTLPQGAGEPASANLRAPVLLGTTARRGRQHVLPDERYGIRVPLDLG